MNENYQFELHVRGLSYGPRGIVVGRGSGSSEAVHAHANSLAGVDCDRAGFETMVIYTPEGHSAVVLRTDQVTKRLKFANGQGKKIRSPTFDSPGID